MTLHVSDGRLSIIRSPRPYIEHQAYFIQVLWLLAIKQPQNLCGMMLYVQSQTHDDGRRDRPKHVKRNSFIDTNLIHNFYINYIKLSSSTCFERHPLIFSRSMMLIVHVCSLWYSNSLQVAELYYDARPTKSQDVKRSSKNKINLRYCASGWFYYRNRYFVILTIFILYPLLHVPIHLYHPQVRLTL